MASRRDIADPSSPVVIGGLGGSGTRAIARIVERGGRFMGANLNPAHDARDLAMVDRRFGDRRIRGGGSWVYRLAFERALRIHLSPLPQAGAPWGWKHPHSYLFIDFLNERFSDLRFIHVIRDGRDMSFSKNQQQLGFYGRTALGRGDDQDPVRRIKFWAWANQRAAIAGESLLGDRYLQVRLEDLCGNPEAGIARLNAFVGADPAAPPAVDEVERPGSLGRWRESDPGILTQIEEAAEEALRQFGYKLATPGVVDLETAVPAPEREVSP